MQENNILLDVKHLRTSFFIGDSEVKAVNDVSYIVRKGEVVAIVGESGCGKSVTQLSVMQLIQMPPGRILGGEVLFEGENLLNYEPTSKKIRSIRGKKIAMIFQEPMTSLNPVITVGKQLVEVIQTHKKVSKSEAYELAEQALVDVGIPDAKARLKNYPFEMSGGMRQRVMIATAVACNSELIIADEPTTALDVTTQAQVMELLVNLVRKKGMSLVIVTHNLGVVNRYADRIYVMYAGHIVEQGTTEQLLSRPRHPYTVGLLESVPRLDDSEGQQLVPIQGAPPSLANLKDQCAFLPRCKFKCDRCKDLPIPPLVETAEKGHCIACYQKIDEVRV